MAHKEFDLFLSSHQIIITRTSLLGQFWLAVEYLRVAKSIFYFLICQIRLDLLLSIKLVLGQFTID